MNLEKLKTLSAQNIGLEKISIVKNGIPCKGIRIIDPTNANVSPIVYYSEQDTLEEIAARINHVISTGVLDMDISLLNDPEYALKNSYLAIRRKCEADYITRECLNLDVHIRIFIPVDDDQQIGSFAVTPAFLEQTEINEDELWAAAARNSRSEYKIRSMDSILGLPDTDDAFMYVVTSDLAGEGAAALYYASEIFENFCREHTESGCYIIPSSTQELILVPDSKTSGIAPSELSCLTASVNAEMVDPILQLDPVTYHYTHNSNTLEIVARADGR